MDNLLIVKIGGNIIDNESSLLNFLQAFAATNGEKILIHGGGKMATQLAAQMNLPQKMVDGRRITDAESLKVVTMVYAGYLNKKITALLQAMKCHALGCSGVDADLIRAHKREAAAVDYGFAGDVDSINSEWLCHLLRKDITPVIAPITHDGHGQLLNTNADTIAQEIAQAMSMYYSTTLVYAFEKQGVLENISDENTLIRRLTPEVFAQLKQEEKIFAGMLPKLDNAFAALRLGVHKIIIGPAEQLTALLNGQTGTHITHDN